MKKKKDKGTPDKKHIFKAIQSYSKGLVSWITFHATVWIYLTYILAFTGREQIAEQLSSQIVDVIMGTIVTYSAKALFENIFKYFPWKNRNKDSQESNTENDNDIGKDDEYDT